MLIVRSRQDVLTHEVRLQQFYLQLPGYNRHRVQDQGSSDQLEEQHSATDLGYSKDGAMQMGQEAFKSVVKSTYKGVAAVLFLYSI